MSNTSNPTITVLSADRIRIAIDRNGQLWEIHVQIDRATTGGVNAHIFSDDELCIGASCDWNGHHQTHLQFD